MTAPATSIIVPTFREVEALPDLIDRVARVLRLGGYVQAGSEFYDIPTVMNGCSDLIVDVFGEAGKHARSAIGVYRLPFNFAVEVDAVIEIVD